MEKNNNIPTFYKNELSKMNCNYPWTGSIKLFELYRFYYDKNVQQ